MAGDEDIQLGALIRAFVQQELGSTHVTCPGIVQAYDPVTQRCSVRPASSVLMGGDELALPVLEDVPVNFFTGGGCGFFLPIKAGDAVQVFFSDRMLDDWRGGAAFTPPADARAHALADAFVVPFAVQPDSAVDPRASADELVIAGPTGTVMTMRPDGTVLVDGTVVTLGGLVSQALTLDPPLQAQLRLLLPILSQLAAGVAAAQASAAIAQASAIAVATATAVVALPPVAAAMTTAATTVSAGAAAVAATTATTAAFTASWPGPTHATKAKAV